MKVEFFPLDTDYRHCPGNDGTCSRCRRKIKEDEIPLYIWPAPDTNIMLIYCDDCIDGVIQLIKEDP